MAALSNAWSRVDSPTAKLALVAVTTTALTSALLLSTQSLLRSRRRASLRSSINTQLDQTTEEEEFIDFSQPTPPALTRTPTYAAGAGAGGAAGGKGKKTSEVIIREALARNYVFFGEEGMKKVRESFVVVVGVGGVGSACATMLVRSGVGKVRIIDFDQVSLSSLNRHSTATLAQVGTPKVISCADSFNSFAPWVEVDPRIELFSKELADELLEGKLGFDYVQSKPDYVVDCIDNIDSKVDLLVYCKQHDIPVFSSLGAASKSDASRIQISDVSTTFEDPLARSVRRRLKLAGITSGIPVVYSTEKPRPEIGLLPLPEEEYAKGKVGELSAINNFRVRILPVLGPLPAMFGNAAATYVLQQLAGFRTEPLPIKGQNRVAASCHRALAAAEQRLTGSNKMPLTEADVLYILEEIHRSRAVAPLYAVTQRPVMLRWRKDKRVEWDNLVVFEKDEGARHEELCLVGDRDPREVWGREVSELVERRFKEERRVRGYRL